MERQVVSYQGITPKISESAFIADGARVVGNIEIGDNCSIWFNTVLRGDVASVKIGKGTSIQDNSTVHVGNNIHCVVGERVTVGHNVLLHGCTVGNDCLIGMGAILLNGSEIGEGSVVAAGSLVLEKQKFPPRSMIVGSPAKVIRTISDEDFERIIVRSAKAYEKKAKEYLQESKEGK